MKFTPATRNDADRSRPVVLRSYTWKRMLRLPGAGLSISANQEGGPSILHAQAEPVASTETVRVPQPLPSQSPGTTVFVLFGGTPSPPAKLALKLHDNAS